MFYSMIGKCKVTQYQRVYYVGNKQVMWKYMLFR